MMFTFRITDIRVAKETMAAGWPSKVVSIVSPEMDWKPVNDNHLVLKMRDIIPQESYAPNPHHVRDLLAFTRSLNDGDNFLIHCMAGQSRSTAAMVAILLQHGMTGQEAFNAVLANRSNALPNATFIQHIDDHFKLEGSLVKIVTNHRQSKSSDEDIDEMKRIMQLLGGN